MFGVNIINEISSILLKYGVIKPKLNFLIKEEMRIKASQNIKRR